MDPTLRRARRTVAALAAAVVFLAGTGGCAPLFFYPSKEAVENPALASVAHEDLFFPSTDGVPLHGLVLRPDVPPKGTVLFLHGNAENLDTQVNAVLWLVAEGYLVFAIDYRGFGRSGGAPDIAGVNRDGVAALDRVYRIPGVDPERVVVFGQSLGGAVAVHAVARAPRKTRVQGLIVDSAFAGYRRIVRDRLIAGIVTLPLAWPASWTVGDRYSPERWIGAVAPVPVVVIHGTRDRIVPFSHGKRLHRLAGDPKEFWVVEGGGHAAGTAIPEVRRQFLGFLESVLPPRQGNFPTLRD
jgi:uncharacterized protein